MTNYEYMKILPKDEMVKFFAELSGVAPLHSKPRTYKERRT